MKPETKLVAIIATILIALSTWGYGYFIADDHSVVTVEADPLYDPARVWTRTVDLTSVKNATQHFEKHKNEFGFQTMDQYIHAAVTLINNKSPDILRNRQKDGDFAYYNPKTAEYAVLSKRGRIRTYFKLDPKIHGYPTNLDFFKAQARKPANDNIRPYEHRPSLQ